MSSFIISLSIHHKSSNIKNIKSNYFKVSTANQDKNKIILLVSCKDRGDNFKMVNCVIYDVILTGMLCLMT